MNRESEQYKNKLSELLFNYETTSRTDYQHKEIVVVPRTKLVEKTLKSKKKPFAPPNYVESMEMWKEGRVVPFNMFIYPNPILGIDPRSVQKPYAQEDLDRERDQDREHAIKTRPRRVMTPAVSLDDVKDLKERSILVNNMYVSTVNAAQSLTASVAFPVDKNVTTPLANTYAPPKPIALPKWKPRYVSTEWRMESVPWDGKQLRGYSDPTRMFWEDRPFKPKNKRELKKM